ncbi:MAG: DUF4339 domain-containing protein [Acidobacteriota bacterium]
MQLYIYRNNERTGPFDEESILTQLKSGTLSPDDLGIRQGETNWTRLGDIFASRIPESSVLGSVAQAATGQNFAPATAKKSGAGCRVALGWIMLVLGLMMTIGGAGLAAATPFIYSMPLCPIAESDYAKLEGLKKKYDAAKGTPFEYGAGFELKQAIDSYDSSSRMCAEERGTRQLFIIGGVAVAVVGFFTAIIGFFLRRVRKS